MARRQAPDRAPPLSDPRYQFLARFGAVILSGGIAAVPRALYYYQAELGLLPQEVWFVGYILAHRWTADLPYPSLRKMARRTGVTYQMLHRYKNSLIAKGYLEVIPRTRANGGRTTNSYDFSGLFQTLEILLRRDHGVMDESLEAGDLDEDGEGSLSDPGQPELIDPGRPSLSHPGKARLTAPDHPETTTRRDPISKNNSRPSKRQRDPITTTTTSRPTPFAEVLTLYAAANGRPATPLQQVALQDLAAIIEAARGPGAGPRWLAAAIREAAESGSGYLSPRRIERICQRWLNDGPPANLHLQSDGEVRTGSGKKATDWGELPPDVWPAVQERLAGELSVANYRAFVRDSRPLGRRNGEVGLAVPDDLTAQRLSGPFRSVVEAAFGSALGERVRLICEVRRASGRGRARDDAPLRDGHGT